MTLEQSTEWLMWATVAMAVATFFAVLAALFGDAVRARMFPAQLELELFSADGGPTEANLVSEAYPNGRMVPARYYHLMVSNKSRVTKATQTQVLLTRVEMPGPDGQMQIKWDSDIPLQWSHQQINPLMRTIGPPARADLFNVIKDKWLAIEPVILPFSLKPFAKHAPGTKVHMVLSVQARSAEGSSPITRFEIVWNGQWHDGTQEMRQNLVVKRLADVAA